MNVKSILIVCFGLWSFQLCAQDEFDNVVLSTWVSAHGEFNHDHWEEKIAYYKSLGIDDILVQTLPENYAGIIEIARQADIKVHAWMWTVNRPNDPIANKHPDWYAVNRNGQNSLDHPAYVPYYQWLSPFHPDAREHIKNNVRALLNIEGLASIHLDYVRYVDVILGADLQPKYKIVQDREMPEYDYDYHPLAREAFKEVFGYDPLDLKFPELSTEWKQFRLNALSTLVNEIIEIAHKENQKITAAVFPFPEMARRMVSQAWNNWNLDAAYPMLYHNFYRESINWIGFAIEQDVRDVDFPIHAGLFMAALTTAEDIEKAFSLAMEKGAKGISMFTADRLTEEQQAAVRKFGLRE